MNNKKLLFCILCTFFILFAVIGCSKTPEFTKLTGVWKFEPYYTVSPDKILVVGKLLNDSNRIPFEDYVVSELLIKNLKAVASYKALPSGKKISKEHVKLAAQVMGIKSVLVTRVVSVDQKEVTVKNSVSYDLYATTMHGAVMMGPYLEEPYDKIITIGRIETGLFDVESESLVWAAKSRMLDPESIDAAIKDYSIAILNQLSQDNIIP
jgi:hypothetical protein